MIQYSTNRGIQNDTPHPTQPFVLYGAGGSGKSALLSKTALQSLKVTMKGDFTSDSGSRKLKVKVKPEKLFKRKSFPKQDCSRIPQGNNKGAIGRGSRQD